MDSFPEAVVLLRRLTLAVGHAPTCVGAVTPCTCGKAAEIREAHHEAARFLRNEGALGG